MKMTRNYAVLILSHGRAENVITINTLRRQGYTGKIYIVLDNTDNQIEKYKELYGEENIVIFNKEEAIEITDDADTFKDKRAVVYARNMCHKIAKELKLDYFLELDDDYTSFGIRYNENNVMKHKSIKNLDYIFELMFKFLDDTNATSVALAQGGDYIGGCNSGLMKNEIRRKVMNSFFCKTDKPFKFYGKINEDYTAYTYLGTQGVLFLTPSCLSLEQLQTQSNNGGLTDIYLNLGTYVKSFYSVIYTPSAVKVGIMGNKFMRIHHKTNWNYCTPMIISEKWKK